MPALLFGGGGAPKEIVGLAMYVASRTAGCAYCSAHCCSFAMRRGTSAEKVTAAYGSTCDESVYSAAEQAVIAAAEGLARIPSTFTAADRVRLEQHFTSAQVEWLGLAVAMMGFLNKFMDAAGVPLEVQTIGEVESVIGASGWEPGKHHAGAMPEGTPPRADTIWTTLGVLRHAPRAVMLDRRWTSGVPAQWPAVGAYLREQTGHDFPILGRLQHTRPRRALATMLNDNLMARHSSVGLQVKTLAGLVYAVVAQDKELAAECERLAENSGVRQTSLKAVADFASMPALFGTDSDVAASELELRSDKRIDEAWCDALLVAKASSYSPAQMTPPLVTRIGAKLPPEALIELIIWISIQQLLHRLGAFFAQA